MGIQDLWTFTLSKFPEVGEKADLTQIARRHADELAKLCGASGPGIDGAQSSLRLVIDADDCLDRLYGGYFNDWICGGSWNRMTTFMQELTTGMLFINVFRILAPNDVKLNDYIQLRVAIVSYLKCGLS